MKFVFDIRVKISNKFLNNSPITLNNFYSSQKKRIITISRKYKCLTKLKNNKRMNNKKEKCLEC